MFRNWVHSNKSFHSYQHQLEYGAPSFALPCTHGQLNVIALPKWQYICPITHAYLATRTTLPPKQDGVDNCQRVHSWTHTRTHTNVFFTESRTFLLSSFVCTLNFFGRPLICFVHVPEPRTYAEPWSVMNSFVLRPWFEYPNPPTTVSQKWNGSFTHCSKFEFVLFEETKLPNA